MKQSLNTKNKLKATPSLLILGVVISLLILSVILFGCNKDNPTPVTDTYYEIALSYDGGEQVDLYETVVYQNNTGTPLTSIAFRLYPNAFKENAEASPFSEDALNQYCSAGNFGGISVSEVKINRSTADFVICGTDDTVLEIPVHLEIGEVAVVSVLCTIDLPYTNHRLGVHENVVNLTGFYPVLCTSNEIGWCKDDYHHFGDPFAHNVASYSVAVTCPSDYVVAGSGQKTTYTLQEGDAIEDGFGEFDSLPVEKQGVAQYAEAKSEQSINMKTEVFYAENIRDFALFLSKDFEVTSTTARIDDGVQVDYYYLYDQSPLDTLRLAVDALERFSSAFGNYPHSSYTVVSGKFIGGGMEYGALSLIASADTNVIVHETAHQWWYGIVGSDQINSPWLDEGLAEFSTCYYHVLRGDEGAYNERLRIAEAEYAKWTKLSSAGFDGVMDKPLYDYLTEGEYVATAYAKGALLFATLRDIMGDEAFVSALHDYVECNKFRFATPSDLIAVLEKHHTGIDGVINSFIAGKDK